MGKDLLLVEKLYGEVEGTEELVERVKKVQMMLVSFMKRLN